MSVKLKESVARELLTILAMKGTPDIIALDCHLKKRYASPARPWPFEDAEDAAITFRDVAKSAQKYNGIAISTDDKNVLRLTKVE